MRVLIIVRFLFVVVVVVVVDVVVMVVVSFFCDDEENTHATHSETHRSHITRAHENGAHKPLVSYL